MSDAVNPILDATTVGPQTSPQSSQSGLGDASSGNKTSSSFFSKLKLPTMPTRDEILSYVPTFQTLHTTKDYSQFFIALVFCFFISIFIIKILRSIQ